MAFTREQHGWAVSPELKVIELEERIRRLEKGDAYDEDVQHYDGQFKIELDGPQPKGTYIRIELYWPENYYAPFMNGHLTLSFTTGKGTLGFRTWTSRFRYKGSSSIYESMQSIRATAIATTKSGRDIRDFPMRVSLCGSRGGDIVLIDAI